MAHRLLVGSCSFLIGLLFLTIEGAGQQLADQQPADTPQSQPELVAPPNSLHSQMAPGNGWAPAISPQPNAAASSTAIASQGGSGASTKVLGAQPRSDSLLEIGPQPGDRAPALTQKPKERKFKPDEDYAALDRNFHPLQNQKPGPPPYLGVTVKYTTECYMRMEEHGLKVLSVYPNSPAEKAVGEAIAGPVGETVEPVMKATGLAPDDLIIAVDDTRVHSDADFEAELRKLKPGDTMYVTAIRPLPGGAHQTLKISIKVGQLNYEETANIMAMRAFDKALDDFGDDPQPEETAAAHGGSGESYVH